MAIINITDTQKTQLTRALSQISLMTHVSIKELQEYIKAGQMPDTVRDTLLRVYNVASLDDIASSTRITSTSRTRQLKTSDVAQIYGAIIKVKEDEAGVTKVPLMGTQKTAVRNIVKELKEYTEDLQQLRDDIEALNSRIINGAQTFDSDQIFSSDYHNKPMNNLRNALNNIGNAIDEYNGAVSELANFTIYLDNNQERDMYYVKRYQDRINSKLSSAKSQCDKAKMAMAEWLTTIVVWDTEDYIDDGM